jgi:hypothetical protein
MATPFADLYEAVRAASGNDDPVIGAEVMPDYRIDVLIRTAVPNLQAYSSSFEATGFRLGATGTYELYPLDPTATDLKQTTITAIALIAAHRYFVGYGNKDAAAELYAMISDLALVAGGEPVIGYKALGVIPERFQVI